MADGKWIYVSGSDVEQLRQMASAGGPHIIDRDLIRELADDPGITEEGADRIAGWALTGIGEYEGTSRSAPPEDREAVDKLRNPQGEQPR